MPEPKSPNSPESPESAAASLHRLETRILRGVGISIPLVTLSLAALWWIFVRAPSPKELCQHQGELSQAAALERNTDAGALLDGIRLRCVDNEERRLRLRGRLVYKERASCIMAAETLDEAERC